MKRFLVREGRSSFHRKNGSKFLPGHDDLFKTFNDSGSKHEFEGYDPEDLEEDFVQQQFYGLSIGV